MHNVNPRRSEKGTEEVFEAVMTQSFSELVRHKTIDQEVHRTPSRVNAKKHKAKLHLGTSFSKYRKLKMKKKLNPNRKKYRESL